MNEEQDPLNEDSNPQPNQLQGLHKAAAILFVFAIYFVIFLKILFID